MNKHRYVIYRLTFADGTYYIGKTKDYERRMSQHQRGFINSCNLKADIVLRNGGFYSEIIAEAPQGFSETHKQIWMDNMERTIIHSECQKVYYSLTHDNVSYKDYMPFRDIINTKIVNTQLY